MPSETPIPLLDRLAQFHDQFLLSRDAVHAPPGWRHATFGGWHLVSHPSLPVARLRTRAGLDAGFAIGFIIGPDGNVIGNELILSDDGCNAPGPAIEKCIYAHGGRFAVAVLLPEFQRFYLDPIGSLAAVWCPRRSRIASTPTVLLLDEPQHPLFTSPPQDLPREVPNQFYPAGLTAAAGISRILPNHYLDLRTWSPHRHHPNAPYEEVSAEEIPRLIATIHAVTHRQIGAATRACGGAHIPLTAGSDSRKLLACARAYLDRIDLPTFAYETRRAGRSADIDVHIAKRLVRRLGLRQHHRLIPVMESIPDQIESEYLLRIGYSGGPAKSRDFFLAAGSQLDLSWAWLPGFTGEVGKSTYWKRMPLESKPRPDQLFRVMRLLPLDKFVPALAGWLDALPDGSPAFCLNMAHFEIKQGGWVAPHLYGAAPFRMNLIPFCHRDIYDAMLSLPVEYKTRGHLGRDLMALAWPELLCLPFNDYCGIRSFENRVRSALRKPIQTLRRHLSPGSQPRRRRNPRPR